MGGVGKREGDGGRAEETVGWDGAGGAEWPLGGRMEWMEVNDSCMKDGGGLAGLRRETELRVMAEWHERSGDNGGGGWWGAWGERGGGVGGREYRSRGQGVWSSWCGKAGWGVGTAGEFGLDFGSNSLKVFWFCSQSPRRVHLALLIFR
ncbi:hypothetical protein Tco_0829075 [Tanacetum coccineum]